MKKHELHQYFPEDTDEQGECDFNWHSLGTLSTGLSLKDAKRALIAWFAEIRELQRPGFLNWVAAFERRRFDQMTRIHILVGLFEFGTRDLWAQRWTDLAAAGVARLYPYRGRKDLLEYIDSVTKEGSYFETEFDLCGQHAIEWDYPVLKRSPSPNAPKDR